MRKGAANGRVRALAAVVAVVALGGCGTGERERPPAPATAASGSRSATPEASAPPRPRIVCLGDSLTAGYGVDPGQAYPALLERMLHDAGLPYEVINAGVSGDTSAGGRRRLDWSLEGDVRVLIVALGANDGLRGLPIAELRQNLSTIVEKGRAGGAAVILAGMEAPPNFGPAYTHEFRHAYREVADRHGVAFIPFFLDGVAGVPALNLSDGLHPNEEGQRRVARLIWRTLEPIARAQAAS